MINFSKLKFKNFLSVGNDWIELNLAENPDTLIVGSNGSGKSTFIDALTFVLYGKPFRPIKKDQMINGTNKKKLLVELEFSVGSKSYKIVRGIKPGKFEIYINDELKDQGSSVKDYQEYLEKNILRMDQKTFRQVVVLGSTTYVPFMKLPLGDRRVVVDEILDIKIFTIMGGILKRYIDNHKIELKENADKLYFLNDKLEENERILADINEKRNKNLKEYENEVKSLADVVISLMLDESNSEKDLTDKEKELSDADTLLQAENAIYNSKKDIIIDLERAKHEIISNESRTEKDKRITICNDARSIEADDLEEKLSVISSKFKKDRFGIEFDICILNDREKDLEITLSKAKSKKNIASKKIIFYEDHDSCEECGQDIQQNFKEGEIKTSTSEVKKYKKVILLVENELDKVEKDRKTMNANLITLEVNYSDLKNKYKDSYSIKLSNIKNTLDLHIKNIETKETDQLTLLEQSIEFDVCDIDNKFEDKIKILTKNKKTLSDKAVVLRTKYMSVSGELRKNETEIKMLKKQISDIKKERADDSVEELVEKTKNDISNCITRKNELYVDSKHYEILKKLFKDDGIKAEIVKAYIPIINALIRKYLEIMEFEIDFRFDENFNETIMSHHRNKFSYSNFSEGEKMRIDLCLLFTLREIARQKNSTMTNLLIFDEIGDSSLDEEGFSSFMKIIKMESEKQNVFVISHKQEMVDNFINVIEFRKDDLFTEMV